MRETENKRVNKRRARLSTLLVGLALAASTALSLAPTASASTPVTVHVTDASGRDQLGAYVLVPSRDYQTGTDELGDAQLSVTAGETIRVTRGKSLQQINCQAPPEGWGGVSVKVPSGVSSGDVIEITLPDVVAPSKLNDPTTAERVFVGMLNDQREAKGLPRLRFSERLNAAAEQQGSDLNKYRADYSCENSPHEAIIRADLGLGSIFYYDGFYGIGGTYGPGGALNYFEDEGLSELMNRSANAIGVSQSGSAWYVTVDVFPDPEDCDHAACQLSEDTGDAKAGSGGGPGGGGGGGSAKPAQIKLTGASIHHGKKLKLSFKVKRADGKLQATIAKKRSPKRIRVRGRGSKRRATVKVKRGRWIVSTKAASRGEQEATSECWKLQVKKRKVKTRSIRCR